MTLKITVRSPFAGRSETKLEHDGTIVDLGFMDVAETLELVEILQCAAEELLAIARKAVK